MIFDLNVLSSQIVKSHMMKSGLYFTSRCESGKNQLTARKRGFAKTVSIR